MTSTLSAAWRSLRICSASKVDLATPREMAFMLLESNGSANSCFRNVSNWPKVLGDLGVIC